MWRPLDEFMNVETEAERAARASKIRQQYIDTYGLDTSTTDRYAPTRRTIPHRFDWDTAPLEVFEEREWVCRVFPYRCPDPCPGCGYTPLRAPVWALRGHPTFGLGGKLYRIVSVGSTNRYAPRGLHNEDVVVCELVQDEPWMFPQIPASKDEILQALNGLNALPQFRARELENAIVAIA